MAQDNYVEGCSMQRPPLLEPSGFFFWKAGFKTYVKSKDIDLWQVIQNGDFYYEIEDSKTKLMKEPPYELLKNDEKKKLGKNNKAKMTLYNALPRIEYIDLLTKEYEKFSISNEETIESGFIRFNAIVTSLKSLDLDYSSKNHSATSSGDSDSQGDSDEDVYEEEEAEVFSLMARNFRKFFRNGNWFGRNNRFGNGTNRIEGHIASECRKPKENKAFVGGAWSDSEDSDEHQNDATCIMAIDSQEVVSKPSSSNYDLNITDLQKENEELLKFNKNFTKTFEKLLNEK
ncbi:hypothetical protein Tco_0850991 [Tanacetum coccineum]